MTIPRPNPNRIDLGPIAEPAKQQVKLGSSYKCGWQFQLKPQTAAQIGHRVLQHYLMRLGTSERSTSGLTIRYNGNIPCTDRADIEAYMQRMNARQPSPESWVYETDTLYLMAFFGGIYSSILMIDTSEGIPSTGSEQPQHSEFYEVAA